MLRFATKAAAGRQAVEPSTADSSYKPRCKAHSNVLESMLALALATSMLSGLPICTVLAWHACKACKHMRKQTVMRDELAQESKLLSTLLSAGTCGVGSARSAEDLDGKMD